MSKINIQIEEEALQKLITNLNESVDIYLNQVLQLPTALSRGEKIQLLLSDNDASKFEAISHTLWVINVFQEAMLAEKPENIYPLNLTMKTYTYPFTQ